MEAKESPLGLYLYCLARASLLHKLAGPGLDGQNSLAVLSFRDIAAIWSPVSLHDFCGEGAAASLQDLAWVGPRACRHEEVVEQVMGLSPVLPARFGTIFSSPDKLERLLRQHHGRIDAFLDRVRGQEEWALKGLLDKARARGEFFQLQLTAAADQLAALSPGKRYFQEQRLRGQADQ